MKRYRKVSNRSKVEKVVYSFCARLVASKSITITTQRHQKRLLQRFRRCKKQETRNKNQTSFSLLVARIRGSTRARLSLKLTKPAKLSFSSLAPAPKNYYRLQTTDYRFLHLLRLNR